MKGRSALPRAAFLGALLILGLGTAAALWGRDLLAELPYFTVQRIEVTGATLVAPDSVVEMAAIAPRRSVFEDFGDVEGVLERHPLIAEASVRRHGWRALRLVIREVEPIALVSLEELRAVRDDGTPLPIQLAGTPLDLPIVTDPAGLDSSSGRVTGPAAIALGTFARLRALDPGLAAVISDFGMSEGGGLVAHLLPSQPARRLALPAEVNETLIRRIRAALADLRGRGTIARLVEARFADQIVVRTDGSEREDGRW